MICFILKRILSVTFEKQINIKFKEKTMSQQHMKALKRVRRKKYIERQKLRIRELKKK